MTLRRPTSSARLVSGSRLARVLGATVMVAGFSLVGVANAEPPRAPVVAPRPPPVARPRVAAQGARATDAAKSKKVATAAKGQRGTGAAAQAGAPRLEPTVSDPGIKVRVVGGRVVVSGVAEGPIIESLPPYHDNITQRGAKVEIDSHKIPDFSKDPDYARKNQWFAGHVTSTSTRKGETASIVAKRLADNLNRGGAFKATVIDQADGTSAIELERLEAPASE